MGKLEKTGSRFCSFTPQLLDCVAHHMRWCAALLTDKIAIHSVFTVQWLSLQSRRSSTLILWPHRLHACAACCYSCRTYGGLCVCLCVGHTGELCKKRINRSRCRLGAGLTRVLQLDGTNPFAATKGDKTAMRPFVKLLWILADTARDRRHNRLGECWACVFKITGSMLRFH